MAVQIRGAVLMGAGFAAADRFIAEVRAGSCVPGMCWRADEIFLYERCRKAVLEALVPRR